MEDDLQKLAAEREKQLGEWLKNFGEAAEIAPHVQRAYSVAKWEAEVVSQAPGAVRATLAGELTPYFRQSLATLSGALPPLPSYQSESIVPNLVAVTTSGTVTHNYIVEMQKSEDASTKTWASTFIPEYQAIQESFNLQERIFLLFVSLKPGIAEEFRAAEDAYQGAIGGWQDTTAAAIAMRNVLEHYKGELFERAIQRPKEQKIKWSDMADRLTVSSIGSPVHGQLLGQEGYWNNLQQDLSNLAKNQSYRGKDIVVIHTEWLDHLYTVLSLVKL